MFFIIQTTSSSYKIRFDCLSIVICLCIVIIVYCDIVCGLDTACSFKRYSLLVIPVLHEYRLPLSSRDCPRYIV